MQTIETIHMSGLEKKALEFFTRASRKRSLATLKTEIGNADPSSDRADRLRQEHKETCATLKRRRKAAAPANP